MGSICGPANEANVEEEVKRIASVRGRRLDPDLQDVGCKVGATHQHTNPGLGWILPHPPYSIQPAQAAVAAAVEHPGEEEDGEG